MSRSLPLLEHDPQGVVAWWRSEPVSRTRVLTHIAAVAEGLPDRSYAINLCEDRYQFLVAFAAVALRGQINLLPVNRARGTVRELLAVYPSAYCISDGRLGLSGLAPVHMLALDPQANGPIRGIPAIPGDQVVAILFTSGSTGRPVPHPKRWADLRRGAELIAKPLGIETAARQAIVATVPPQHMYGLEISILLPLRSGVSLHGGRPFYPEDIRGALLTVPPPRLLVTTPAHLRALAAGEPSWPEIDCVVSATAPLAPELARRVEDRLLAPVVEIFGCTEAGTMATRRTAREAAWTMLSGMALHAEGDQVLVTGPQLPEAVVLSDLVELHSPTQFRLLGRRADQVNIAGKRASLADLNLKLLAIAGVADGVFVAPDETDGVRQRLAALVVAPHLSEREILEQLREFLDPAFLPRPLVKVAALPRTDTGKLPREKLLALLSVASGQA